MNILLVTPFQLTDVGGISVIVRMLYREWSKKGHAVTILAPGHGTRIKPSAADQGAPVYTACLRLPYIRQAPLRAFLSFWLHLPLTLIALARFLAARRIDVVVLQYPLPWVFYFALLRPFSRWRLVVTLQGSDVHKLPSQNWVDRRLLRGLLTDADAVLAASQSLLDELQRALPGLRMAHTQIMPNGAPVDQHVPWDRVSWRARMPVAYILTVGQVIHRKGLDVLIRALEGARDRGHPMNLVVVGDGPERPALLRMAAEAGLANHVYFAGNRTHEEVLEFIKGCLFFVLASRAEGLPLVLLEAMICGKAVVATRVDGIPEVVRHGQNGLLVDPEDASSLTEALIKLRTDSALRYTLGVRGQELVSREYTWEAIGARYLEVFQSLHRAPSQPYLTRILPWRSRAARRMDDNPVTPAVEPPHRTSTGAR